MIIDVSELKVSGHHLYLSERPPSSSSNKKQFNEYALGKFLEMLKQNDINTIVVLLSERSMINRYGKSLVDIYKEAGYKVIHYPIRDFEAPEDLETFHKLITKISNALKSGNVLMHCGAGLGRTGLVAAGLAIFKGFKPHGAISIIRNARPGTVESVIQEDFLREYYSYFQMKRQDTNE
jgi:protein tyrosine/serine phosphatase